MEREGWRGKEDEMVEWEYREERKFGRCGRGKETKVCRGWVSAHKFQYTGTNYLLF